VIKKTPNLLLALISALLLSASWFEPFTILAFVAWVPLLMIEDNISLSETAKRKKLKLIGLVYFTFFVWNACVTWWIYFASLEGACLAIFCNAILMTMVFMIWYNLKKRLHQSWAIWLLIPIWLGFEYGHTLWDLTWTWLTLGNVFANTHHWVQWYEFTGTSGGSLWILAVNILIFKLIKENNYALKAITKPIVLVIVPILVSYIILNYRASFYKTKVGPNVSFNKTLLIQPNVDPYNDKFNTEPQVQLQNLVKQMGSKLDSTVDYLVLPETYLTENIYEGEESQSFSLRFLRDSILSKYPHLTIITGASTMYAYKPNETPSATANKFYQSDKYYDAFNTGMQIDQHSITSYHKSKLVPGVEKMPFPALFKPLEKLAINLGGTMGSLGTQEERTVFFSHNKTVGIAPVICYESVYPDYVGQYVRNGANLIFIITNDGWWENTPGHRQHLAYAKLRAIENRREIARCANTGISCFITPLGDIEQATTYWEQAMIEKNMTPNNDLTIFSRFGDLISYTSGILALLLLCWSQYLRFKKS
jgi:apolipoprotein N-acyltransferase